MLANICGFVPTQASSSHQPPYTTLGHLLNTSETTAASQPDDTQYHRVLEKADRQLAPLNTVSPDVYSLLHHTCAQLASVDAFYICLYSPWTQTLHFPYNFDGQLYNDPVTLPIGNGPTSWVIKNKKPFILAAHNAKTQSSGIHFGDIRQKSQSAMHLPIRTFSERGSVLVLGVLSAQSYQLDAYTPEHTEAIQWLADRLGLLLQRNWDREQRQAWQEPSTPEILEEPPANLAELFVKMMQRIEQRAEALHHLLPAHDEDHILRTALSLLRQECRLVQTEAVRYCSPETAALFKPAAAQSDLMHKALLSLTEREQQILELMAQGLSNPQISARLHVSPDTIKFHNANIYSKLKVSNRTQAAQTYLSAALTSPHSEPE